MKGEGMGRFRKTPCGNEYLKGNGFYVSFNENPGLGLHMFQSDTGGAETALVIEGQQGTIYLILNGDFRDEYEAVIDDGLEACRCVYDAHQSTDNSSWTTRKEDR